MLAMLKLSAMYTSVLIYLSHKLIFDVCCVPIFLPSDSQYLAHTHTHTHTQDTETNHTAKTEDAHRCSLSALFRGDSIINAVTFTS